MSNALLDNVDLWTGAVRSRSTAGRGSNRKIELAGIKKLRELILELAVRGKLVPQDASDEPASELLKRIEAEKAQLVKDGKIKKQKPLPPIGEDEKPFELPSGWEWVRLASLASYIQRGKSPIYVEDSKFIVISQKCIQWSGFDVKQARFIDERSIENYSEERFLLDNDLLLNSTGTGTVGRVVVACGSAKNNMVADSHVTVIRLLSVSSLFVCNYIKSSGIQKKIEPEAEGSLVSGTTKQVELNTSTVNILLTPIPPLAEQHRIVTKVDELMQLCDQLEQHTDQQHAAHQQLVETLLNALTQASSAADLAEQWQRIAAHFDGLFVGAMGEWAVDRLKDSILQLAVMGKLVPQDPNDEPASELLKRIEAKKTQLIKDGKIKKQKPLPPVTDEEKPFEVPEGWEWVRFANIVDIQSGIAKGKNYNGKKTIDLPYLRVANVQRGYLVLDEIKEIQIDELDYEKYIVNPRDLLITEGGDWDKVGRTAIWPENMDLILHQNHVFKARLYWNKQSEIWLEKYLNGTFARDYFAGSSKQTTNLASINKTQLSHCVLPLPPLAEQHRIVTKVDALFNLCDQLKTRIQAANQLQLQLTDTLVQQALA